MNVLNWLGSWVCFYLGDFVADITHLADEEDPEFDDWWCTLWNPAYQLFMLTSSNLQDAGIPTNWPPVWHEVKCDCETCQECNALPENDTE